MTADTPRRLGLTARRWRLLIAGVALAGLLIAPQYIRVYRIHGPSDAPNYLWGDIILVSRAAYDIRVPFSDAILLRVRAPRRGEAVLIRLPDADHDVTRRIVGLPGDTVELRESRVVLNGRRLDYEAADVTSYATADSRNEIGTVVDRERGEGVDHLITYTPGACGVATVPPVTVPEGRYYVLGDNRDHCTDSRRLGPIPREWVRGRIVGKLWSGRG